jgi:hypothetical protein
MRIARKFVLLALAAVAAMAFMASSASATNGIQVVNEKTATVCSAIVAPHTTGGCNVHAVGLGALRIEIFGVEGAEGTCNMELDMRISGTGVSAVDDMELSPGDANCNNTASAIVVECNLPWEGRGEKDAAGHAIAATADVCFNPAESPFDCAQVINFTINETEATEHYDAILNNVSIAPVCEVDVDMEIESAVSTNAAIHVN